MTKISTKYPFKKKAAQFCTLSQNENGETTEDGFLFRARKPPMDDYQQKKEPAKTFGTTTMRIPGGTEKKLDKSGG